MHDLIFRLHKDWLIVQRTIAFGMSCLIVCGSLTAFGQPSSLTPQILSAQQQVKWIKGPATVSLGQLAEMEIPAGYLFADAAAGRMLYQAAKNSAPPGLVGILKTESETWSAVMEFSEMGYIRSSSLKRIDAPAILDRIEAKFKKGSPLVKSVNWELPPQYDSADNSLAYAIRIAVSSEAIVQQSTRLFARNGVLAATATQNPKVVSEPPSLKELLGRVKFKEGQRYQDFQETDKVADFDTYQLLTGDEQTMAPKEKGWKAFFNVRKKILWWENSMAAWIAMCAAVCVFVLVLYLVAREIRSLNPKQSFRATPAAARNGAEVKSGRMRRAFNGTDASGRKRAFDYQKYYSDMMMQVSTRAYTGLSLRQGEETVEETDNQSASEQGSSSDVADAQKGAASELIARQKDFIEEQRRLMQQQTKLIEERSKLIEEKNQLLAKQSEMLENHLL